MNYGKDFRGLYIYIYKQVPFTFKFKVSGLVISSKYVYVISWFWPHCIKIVHDVNIVIKSWWGAQGQGPTMFLPFYVSTVKIDAYGYSAS